MSPNNQHWTQYLLGKAPCRFPTRNDGMPSERRVATVNVGLGGGPDRLADLAHLYVAWGLVMRLYAGNDRAAFAALDCKPDTAFSTGSSVVSFEADIEVGMSIAEVIGHFRHQMENNVREAGSVESESWVKTDEKDLPCNTLVLLNTSAGSSFIDSLHEMVRIRSTAFKFVAIFVSDSIAVSNHHSCPYQRPGRLEDFLHV